MSNGDTGKRVMYTPSISCSPMLCERALTWANDARSTRIISNDSEGGTDSIGNSCCATNRINEN